MRSGSFAELFKAIVTSPAFLTRDWDEWADHVDPENPPRTSIALGGSGHRGGCSPAPTAPRRNFETGFWAPAAPDHASTVRRRTCQVVADRRGQSWISSPILSAFDKLRNDMVVMKGVDCPRKQEWIGDRNAAGMIAMMAPPPLDKGPSDLHVWPALPQYSTTEQNDTNGQVLHVARHDDRSAFLAEDSGPADQYPIAPAHRVHRIRRFHERLLRPRDLVFQGGSGSALSHAALA